MKNIEVCLTPELLKLYTAENKAVVVVDIFRATSTMVTALSEGVAAILPVEDLETCRQLSSEGYIIAGERNGQKAEGFVLGNSPLEYLEGAYSGQKIAMTTTNGTFAINQVKEKAEEILMGAFLNLQATADYLHTLNLDVLILCAGWKGKFNLEDTLYAGALVSLLSSTFDTSCDGALAAKFLYEQNSDQLESFLSQASHTKRLQNHNIEQDIKFCLTLNKYPIVVSLSGKILTITQEK
jgi:2-phosphosulfolactate phosphatase